jgi:hypothetical protein
MYNIWPRVLCAKSSDRYSSFCCRPVMGLISSIRWYSVGQLACFPRGSCVRTLIAFRTRWFADWRFPGSIEVVLFLDDDSISFHWGNFVRTLISFRAGKFADWGFLCSVQVVLFFGGDSVGFHGSDTKRHEALSWVCNPRLVPFWKTFVSRGTNCW